MKHLVLIGFMASGKSTLASLLHNDLKIPIFSSDEWIVSQTHRSIAEIFALYGEREFRVWEKRAFEEISSLSESHILDCGGGFVLGNDVRALGRVYYLKVGLREIMARLQDKQESFKRPLAKDVERLYFQRESIYALQSSKIVLADRGENEVFEEVMEDWKRFNALLPIQPQQDRHK